jgi:hypothetical protein
VAVVAHKPGVFKPLVHTIGGEVQPVRDVLPLRNQGSYIVVHGQIGIPVDLAPHEAQIPPTVVVGIPEFGEVEGFRRCHNEKVAHARVVIHEPIGGPGKEDPVVPSTPGEVILLGRVGEDDPGRSIGVDMEDGHKGIFGDPIVEPGRFSLLKDRFMASVQPYPCFQRIGLVVLGAKGSPGRAESGPQDHQQRGRECMHPHGVPPLKHILPRV